MARGARDALGRLQAEVLQIPHLQRRPIGCLITRSRQQPRTEVEQRGLSLRAALDEPREVEASHIYAEVIAAVAAASSRSTLLDLLVVDCLVLHRLDRKLHAISTQAHLSALTDHRTASLSAVLRHALRASVLPQHVAHLASTSRGRKLAVECCEARCAGHGVQRRDRRVRCGVRGELLSELLCCGCRRWCWHRGGNRRAQPGCIRHHDLTHMRCAAGTRRTAREHLRSRAIRSEPWRVLSHRERETEHRCEIRGDERLRARRSRLNALSIAAANTCGGADVLPECGGALVGKKLADLCRHARAPPGRA
mmetsp:Transcript_10847/g.44953  ORF Transcript_10847/g.44953 Transcript_10847/m.44953 type:complete len:309 (+) Transcript_10847:5158-6084(+)